MTIKELCEKYNCDDSGIYKKIKRKQQELEGHIITQNGIVIIDEYAEEKLKPSERQMIMKSFIEKGKGADWELERARGKCEIEASRRRDAENEIEKLRDQNDELRSEILRLRDENGNLLAQVSELKRRLMELEQKPKSLFGWR